MHCLFLKCRSLIADYQIEIWRFNEWLFVVAVTLLPEAAILLYRNTLMIIRVVLRVLPVLSS